MLRTVRGDGLAHDLARAERAGTDDVVDLATRRRHRTVRATRVPTIDEVEADVSPLDALIAQAQSAQTPSEQHRAAAALFLYAAQVSLMLADDVDAPEGAAVDVLGASEAATDTTRKAGAL